MTQSIVYTPLFKMKQKVYLTLLLTFLLVKANYAQKSSFQIGTQIPLMYSIGFEYETNSKVAFNVQAGILTKPYDAAILNVMKMFGTNEAVVYTIGESFKYGFIFQPSVKYYFNKRYYTGVSYSYYMLFAEASSEDAIQDYYGIRLPPSISTTPLTLQSNLSNIGMYFGRKFNFKNSNVKLLTEISFAKTVYSKSKLMADSRAVPILIDKVDKDLNSYYVDYGYLPSINVFVLVPFKK